MQPRQNDVVRVRTALFLFLAAAAAIWAALEFTESRSGWLRAEAPRRAVEGEPFTVRVHLAPQPEPGVLYADLHWGTSRDTPMQYLATGGPRSVGKEGGTFDFRIMVPHRDGLRFVMGVIFWGPTPGWSNHRLAACTKVIPVVAPEPAAPELPLEPLKLQPPSDQSLDRPRPSAIPRALTGLLFLAGIAAAFRRKLPTNQAASGLHPQHRVALALPLILALACLWELVGLEVRVGAHIRALARAEDLYNPRAIVQKIVTSLTVAAATILIVMLRRVPKPRRLLTGALTLYTAIAVVSLVSLHAIDRIAGVSWHGWTLVQTLKLVCAALVLYGLQSSKRPALRQ